MTRRRIVQAGSVTVIAVFFGAFILGPVLDPRVANSTFSRGYRVSVEPDGTVRHEFGGRTFYTPSTGR